MRLRRQSALDPLQVSPQPLGYHLLDISPHDGVLTKPPSWLPAYSDRIESNLRNCVRKGGRPGKGAATPRRGLFRRVELGPPLIPIGSLGAGGHRVGQPNARQPPAGPIPLQTSAGPAPFKHKKTLHRTGAGS